MMFGGESKPMVLKPREFNKNPTASAMSPEMAIEVVWRADLLSGFFKNLLEGFSHEGISVFATSYYLPHEYSLDAYHVPSDNCCVSVVNDLFTNILVFLPGRW